MDETIRRLLGIRKKTSWMYDLWYKIRKIFSIKFFIVLFILLVLLASMLLFARYEFIAEPEAMARLNQADMNPYTAAFFWLIVTIATGYEETPITNMGKTLNLFIILVSVVAVAVLISKITSVLLSANLKNMFGMAATKDKIDCIICGWNPISESAFNEIKKPEVKIVIIDKQNRPELSKAKGAYFIAGDPANPDVLKKANINNAKSIVLAMEEDADVLLAIHVIRGLNPWINIVAKINNHEHVKIAESAGADQVVSPPSIGGRLLSMVSEEPSVVDWVIRATSSEKGTQLIEYDVTKDSPFAGKTVGDARTQRRDKGRRIGVDTAEGFEKIPGDELKIEPGNKLIMMVDTKKFRI
ncbi:potassium channel protein [archaeon]|nr:potassium channel protein [archaeon]